MNEELHQALHDANLYSYEAHRGGRRRLFDGSLSNYQAYRKKTRENALKHGITK